MKKGDINIAHKRKKVKEGKQMRPFYELSGEYEAAYEEMEAMDKSELSEGEKQELMEAFLNTLEGIEGEMSQKAEAVALWIVQIKLEADAIKAEAERLQKRRKTKQNTEKRLRERLTEWMEYMGKDKIETARARISVKQSSYCYIPNEKAFIEYAICEQCGVLNFSQPTINKNAVRESIKGGEQMNGLASIEKRKSIKIT